jgi:hypothetical protein
MAFEEGNDIFEEILKGKKNAGLSFLGSMLAECDTARTESFFEEDFIDITLPVLNDLEFCHPKYKHLIPPLNMKKVPPTYDSDGLDGESIPTARGKHYHPDDEIDVNFQNS